MVKAKEAYPSAPTMTALCCAACLHAITAPEEPVRYDDCFFHASHLPPDADVGSF